MKRRQVQGGSFYSQKTALFAGVALAVAMGSVGAVQPTVKTVPWVASNPLIPHDTISGESHTLKGTTDVQGANFTWTWDFGDGSPVASGNLSAADSNNGIEAAHTYTGPVGTVFTAKLTVEDTNTGETDTEFYYVAIRTLDLTTEVNMAIDQGLWYLHKTQRRYVDGGTGLDFGEWDSGNSFGNQASLGWCAGTAANATAFLVNGHLETGDASNPYTSTVQRAMRATFACLNTRALSRQTVNGVNQDPEEGQGPPAAPPALAGNGYGIFVTNNVNSLSQSSRAYYEGGMLMDAIVATGTPDAIAATGKLPAAPDPGVRGRTYKEIVQDMADEYVFAAYDSVSGISGGGGWRYSTNQYPDNSACQWAAIGLIAAEREFGCITASWIKPWNQVWLNWSQDKTAPDAGEFGYTDETPIWGPTATTPSGMVQMAWVGIGRGSVPGGPWPAGHQPWDLSETYMRHLFPDGGGNSDVEVLSNYYGLFSMTKSLLLHDSNADGMAEPIHLLDDPLENALVAGSGPGFNDPPIDWYSAQIALGDETDGVARTLVNDQFAAGYWQDHHIRSSEKQALETSQAIIMLNRTVFASGVPVAVCEITPNPSIAGVSINFSGSLSFHQDPSLEIVSWEWDFDNDGTYDATGPNASHAFPAVGNYPVVLRVTDDDTPPQTATTTCIAEVKLPPAAPTADANGPYSFCPDAAPWFLDGTDSVNPDDGQSEPGAPGDFIKEYAWDLDGDGAFDDATGVQPDVTAYFTAAGPGSYLIQFRVTDNTALSFPTAGADLSGVDSTVVVVRSATDPECECIDDLVARPKDGKIQLVWSDTGAASYNVYRSTISGGPYLFLANTTSTWSTHLDDTVANGTPYYYVVRPTAINGDELCQSNEASGTAVAIGRRTRP